jgi:hypothetical protein
MKVTLTLKEIDHATGDDVLLAFESRDCTLVELRRIKKRAEDMLKQAMSELIKPPKP